MGSKYFAKLTLVLFLITTITAGLLGLVNAVTYKKIAEINVEKTTNAMKVVMPDATAFDKTEYKGKDTLVATAYVAKKDSENLGYVIEVKPSGFGGEIDMVVGISAQGKVTGVSIINMTETSGLGTKANDDSFRNQFTGKSGKQAVNKDGGTINALTGATITSRAVTKGVNSALEAVRTLG